MSRGKTDGMETEKPSFGIGIFCREKIHPLLDQLLIVLLLAFAVVSVAFPHGPVDTVTGLISIIWLIKLFTGGVRFSKGQINPAILVTVALVLFSYFKFKHLIYADYNQRQIVPPLLWYFIISTIPIKTKQARWFLSLAILSMVVLTGYFLIGQTHMHFSAENRLDYWGHPTIFADYIAVFFMSIFILLLRERTAWRRNLMAGFLIPLIFGILFTYARGGWVSLSFCLVVSLFLVRESVIGFRTKLFYGVLAGLAVGLPLLNVGFLNRLLTTALNSSDQQRFVVWRSAIRMFESSPIFGVGLNMYRNYYCRYNHISIQDHLALMHAHNNILQILAELGLVGFAIFVFLIVTLYRTAFQLKKASQDHFQTTLLYIFIAGLTLVLIHGMFDYSLNMRPSWYYLMTILAIATSLPRGATNCPEQLGELDPGKI